jgi:hypothetical protein
MATVTQSQEQIDAGYAFAYATMEALQTDRMVDPETAVLAAARMAGTFLFRSFGFALPNLVPGEYVLSAQANEHFPRLVGLLSSLLLEVGIRIDETRRGASWSPDRAQLSVVETQRLLGPEFAAIRDRHGLSLQQAAEAGAVATATILSQCAKALDPNVAFSVAVTGFIEGTKTVPDPAAS